MLNFNIKAKENERKDGYSIEVHGKVAGNGEMIEREIYELLMRLDELEGDLLLKAFMRFIDDKCESEECEHEDD